MKRRYSTYNQSNLPTFSEVPQHWRRTRLKYLGFMYGGLTGKSGDDFRKDEEAPNIRPFIPFTNICNNIYISKGELKPVFIKEGESQNRVEKDDLFFLMSSETHEDIGKTSVLKEDLGEVYLNSFCKGYRLTQKETDPCFLNYLLLGNSYRQIMSIEGNGFTRVNLRQDRVNDFMIFLPPLQEQEQIVKYLDQKTQDIDKLISITESKIKLLKENRTSIINRVITKGLDPNVEMKDSGVEWIGEIPKHWRYIPMKYITENKGGIQTGPFGTQLNTKDYVKDGVKVMNQKTLIEEDYSIGEEYISFQKFEDLKGFEVLEGDIIMGTRGSFGNGTRTTFGKCSIVPENVGQSVLHPCLIRIRLLPSEMSKSFYYIYINQSSLFLEDIQNTSNSTTIEVIYGITLKEVKLPVPPVPEQEEIVKYLDGKTKGIDNLISIEQQRIETLKEYRQSLISEVVTGKVRVCEEVKS